MTVSDLLTIERTFIDTAATSKSELLQRLARLAAASGDCRLDEQGVYQALLARERLGSTGIGEGIAIPHCRSKQCSRPFGVLLKLSQPVAFDSPDGHPVDLLFALITPAADASAHLRVLGHLASLFNQADYRQALRDAGSAEELFRHAAESPLETLAS